MKSLLNMDTKTMILFLFVVIVMHCNCQSTVKSTTTSPYCNGLQENVMIQMTELRQDLHKLQQELKSEKDARGILEKKFEREEQRLEAFAAKKSVVRIEVQYTVENLVYGQNFEASQSLNVPQTFFINIMKEAAHTNSVYNFTSTEYDRYGEYIMSINGLPTNNEEHLYWALIQRNDIISEDCLINVGVSFYIPTSGEHIVFQYRSWDNPLSGCEGLHD